MRADAEPPKPATEPPEPARIASVEELYLTGLHLEQYRHATRSAESYWTEGLKREPDHARLNNAMGLAHLRKGEFARAEDKFARAARRLTIRNPNPYDGEPFYNLGLACLYQGKTTEACEAFSKSVWNHAWQSAGYYALASISAGRLDLPVALEQVEKSLLTNVENLKARALRASLLRRMGRIAEAQPAIGDSLALDRLDFRMMAERFFLSGSRQDRDLFLTALEGDVQTLLDVSFDLAWCGSRQDAFLLLHACGTEGALNHPMLWYTLSWLAGELNEEAAAMEYLARGEQASPRYCFPARLEEMIVLEDAIRRNPMSAKAHYYLGNLYYDKRRHEDAIRVWRRSIELDDTFSIPLRNLGIAEFNVLHDSRAADQMYRRAFAANQSDARLLYEWDQLRKRAALASPEERIQVLSQHRELVAYRDDLTVEFVTLLNQRGQNQAALEVLSGRHFSPWEGGEGLASAQWIQAHKALGRAALAAGKPRDALDHLEAARHYPENLGEGKHLLTLERDLDYYSGMAARELGDFTLAHRYWTAASAPLPSPGVHSYFQARALDALGNAARGSEVLVELARFAAEKRQSVAKIDYFATSLPNLLLFDDDLETRNRIESLLLSALASYGLGNRGEAAKLLEQVIAEDPNHLIALETLNWLRQEGKASSEEVEVRPVA